MRRLARLVFARAVMLAATAAVTFGFVEAQTVPRTQGLDPVTRSQLEADLMKANGVGAYLHVANRYAAAGHPQQAKAVVDRAAREARTSGDWRAIASEYQRLGYPENAAAAQRKARDATR